MAYAHKKWVLCQGVAIGGHDAWPVDGRTLLARVGKGTDVEPMRERGQWLEVVDAHCGRGDRAGRKTSPMRRRPGSVHYSPSQRNRSRLGAVARPAWCLPRACPSAERGTAGLHRGLRQRERDSRAWPDSDIGRERRFAQTLGFQRPGERADTAPARRWRRIVESEDWVTLLRRNI